MVNQLRLKTAAGLCSAMLVASFPISKSAVAVPNSGSTSASDQSVSPIILTGDDYGSKITAKPGTPILIKLEENRTSNYRWSIGKTDNRLLDTDGMDFDSDPGPASSGVTGTKIFRFKAKAPGTVHLVLNLKRIRSTYATAVKSFMVDIQIR